MSTEMSTAAASRLGPAAAAAEAVEAATAALADTEAAPVAGHEASELNVSSASASRSLPTDSS